MLRSYLFSIFILLCAVLIETAVLSNITVLPAIPDLLLICTLYFSLNNGAVFGQSMGFISGLFIDFMSGAPFGLNCLVRTLLGYTSGLFKKVLNINSFFVLFLIGLGGTVVKALFIYLASIFFPNMVSPYSIFSLVFVFELGFNAFLTPFIFKFLGCFSKFIIVADKV